MSPPAPRIGIVMPLAEQRGGAELALLHFLAGLPRPRRATVQLCFLEDGPLVSWVADAGYAVSVIPSGRLRQPLDAFRCIGRLRRWIRDGRCEVVLSWMAKAHLYAGPAASLAGVPSAWWQHGLPVSGGVDLLATLLPARTVLACSDAAASAQRRVWGNRAAPVTVHPPVDLDRLHHAALDVPAKDRFGLPSQAFVIGIVARLQRWKGIHVLLDALAVLLPQHPTLHCVVVGGEHRLEPDCAPALQRQVDALSLAGHVHFLGHRTDVPQCLAMMDIVVSASLGEPFGMVIVEAMALARPVVATQLAGPLEIITNGVNGILVPPEDAQALARALARLVGDPGLRDRLGNAAKQHADSFGIPRFVEQVSAVLAEAAA